MVECAVWFLCDGDIKKGDLAGLPLLHGDYGELDAGVLLVDVLQELQERVGPQHQFTMKQQQSDKIFFLDVFITRATPFMEGIIEDLLIKV